MWRQRDLSMLSPPEYNFNPVVIESAYITYLHMKKVMGTERKK